MAYVAPFIKPILAHVYDPARADPKGMWMSEKLDGVRACWTGDRLLTRTGKPIAAPASWLKRLPPAVALDGELTLGRGRFQDTVSVVRSKSGRDADWASVRYCVFDAPAAGGPFSHRQDLVLAAAQARADAVRAEGAPAVVTAVSQEVCRGPDHLERELEAMLAAGGEGLMLRDPASMYEPGKRTRALLKVKRFLDAEAEVLEHVAGKGKHTGRMGALRVRCLENGSEFKIGTGFDDARRADPPAVGAVVTYKYQERTRAGAPRFPVFLREREREPQGTEPDTSRD